MDELPYDLFHMRQFISHVSVGMQPMLLWGLSFFMKVMYRNKYMHATCRRNMPLTFHCLSHAKRKINSLRLNQSTFQPYGPAGPLRQKRKRPASNKNNMSLTFFTHLDGKRPHFWTRHLHQPIRATLNRRGVTNSSKNKPFNPIHPGRSSPRLY